MLNNELLMWMKSPPSQVNDLTAENNKKEWTNEDLSLSVVDLANETEEEATEEETIEEEAIETEQHIPPENDPPEEFVSISEAGETEDHVSSHSLPQIEEETHHIEEETPDPKPLLTPEEEAATWKDYKGVLFDELNRRETAFGKSYDLEKNEPQYQGADTEEETSLEEETSPAETEESFDQTQAQDELYSHVPEADSRDDISPSPHKYEASTDTSKDEISQSYRERKIHAVALAEEFRKNRMIASEQAGRMRKRRLILLGGGLVLLIALITTVSFSFFKTRQPDPTADSDLNESISSNIDINTYSLEIKVLPDEDSDDIAHNIESEHEEYTAVLDSEDESVILDETASPDLEQIVIGAEEPDEPPLISKDDEQAAEQQQAVEQQDLISSETMDLSETTDLMEVRADDERLASVDDKAEAEKTASETQVTTAPDTARTVERTGAAVTSRTRARTAETARRTPARADRRDSVSPVTLMGKEPPRGAGPMQDEIYSAIKDEKYTDAINLSKSNLERNSNDKLSFFSLGLALYAASNYSGAAEAFYSCLKFNDSSLPNFLVEEFDPPESLKNLYIDYPGVDLLLKAVELNPKNKSLYLNLFLSNLKSEKPRAASEIYTVILNHARKHGSSLN